jgi:hypothetical protein
MIHIVFNEADVAVLEQAIALDETLAGKVLQIKDDFAVGPLYRYHDAEGELNRRHWWAKVLEGGNLTGTVTVEDVNRDHKVADYLKRTLTENKDEVLWIWAAQNKHDVCGYYWLMSELKELQGQVFILYLNNLPFFNDKGTIFYPTWLSSIPPKEFLKAKKLARPITLSEFEVDPDEWDKLITENKGVRLLEGGKKLVQKSEDYYDAEIKKYITTEFQKASKIIHLFLTKSTETTGDMYMLWRLKEIIKDSSKYEVQGKLENMKDFEVKALV